MFDSQWLISRRGPFGVIWIAAHCLKRLKNDELKQTDVLHSVEKILELGVPAVSHRILAFLLLGVVRIYSKKVEFLFHDCCDVLDKVGHLKGGKGANESIEALRRTSDFVSLPERFELDAFDLEVLEDESVSRKHVRSPEDKTPSDALRERKKHLNDKYHAVEDATCSEPYFSAYTPVRDVYSPGFVNSNLDVAMLCDKSNLKSSVETLCGKWFSEERLEPMIFNYAEKDLGFDMLHSAGSNTNTERIKHPDEKGRDEIRLPDEEKRNMENSCGIGCLSEELLEPMSFDNVEKESDLALLLNIGFQSDRQQMKHVDSGINMEEPEGFVRPSVIEKNIEAKERRQLGSTSLLKLPKEKQPLSINTDFASDSKFRGAPDSIAVCTPATKEHSTLLKKRKYLFDGAVVFPNKIIKQMIEDSSDLVCKRRKAPHSVLQAWKAQKISGLPKSLFEHLIPCKAVDLGSVFYIKTSTAKETETEEVPLKQVSVKSLTLYGSDEETPIAPDTPVSHSTLLRLHEVRGVSRCDTLRPSSSLDSFEGLLRQDETQELVSSLADKEKSSPCGGKVEKYECSARTRRVASYLFKTFVKQRKLKGDGTVTLSQILERKSERESARLFHEILVLKTGDYINIRQENAYADIFLEETSKLKDLSVEA